jgi:hypothetical protein
LRQIVTRDLATETINGSDGRPRVKLRLPTWDDYLTVAVDEITAISPSWPVQRRVAPARDSRQIP